MLLSIRRQCNSYFSISIYFVFNSGDEHNYYHWIYVLPTMSFLPFINIRSNTKQEFQIWKKEANAQQWFFIVSAAAHTCVSVHFAFLLFRYINLTIRTKKYNRLAQNNLGTNTGIARFGVYNDLKRRCKWGSDADSHARLVVCFCSFSIINMNQLTFLRCHSVTQNMFTKWIMRSDTR